MYMNINRKIYNNYDVKRRKAQMSLDDRIKDIFKNIPEIKEADDEIKELGLKLSRYAIENSSKRSSSTEDSDTLESSVDDQFVMATKARIKELSEYKTKLLLQNGYPKNYLDPIYECSICDDTGYIVDSTGSHRCSCYRQNLIDELYKNSNIDTKGEFSFDKLDYSFYSDEVDVERYGIKISPRDYMREIVDKCLYFVDNFKRPDVKNIMFRGTAGVGKTYLCGCIANTLISKGVPVLYLSSTSLFNIINEERMSKFKQSNSFKTQDYDDNNNYDNIMKVDILIIDDLGTESATPSRYAELLELLNTREANNRVRPCKTILSTNLSIKEVYERYSERIGSRIAGTFNIYRLVGEDIRIIKK